MDTLRQDLAYALRRLWHSPGFSLVAIATLALGIGANSAIFSVVNAVLLRPLPFPGAERLVNVGQLYEGRSSVYSPQNFLDMQAQATSFQAVAAYDAGGLVLGSGGPASRVEAAEVSAPFFDVLGVRPTLGRSFVAGDNESGHHRVAVLGHDLWTTRFGGDPALVGRTIQVSREPFTVIGVAPPGFSFPEDAQLWTAMEYDTRFRTKSRGAWYLRVVGRLREGVSARQASQEVATIMARLARQYPDQNEGVGGVVEPLRDWIVGDTRGPLLVLLGAVGFVLLIACVNVANLLLARMAAREGELAVRSALGAGRTRIVRQLLTESVVLAAAGGAAGVALAWLSLDVLLALQPEGVPRLGGVTIDGAVLAFAAAASLVTGLVFGAFPALHTTRRPMAVSLREGSRGLLGARGSRVRGGLVVGQIALAMVLLAGAGLLVRSFERLRRVDPGFRTVQALGLRLTLPEAAYPKEAPKVAFYDRLLPRLKAIPGVEEVGAVTGLPLTGVSFGLSFVVEGRAPVPPAQQPTMQVRVATPAYFTAIGVPLLRGRLLSDADHAEGPPAVLISAGAAERFFPGEDPLGRYITLGWGRGEGQPKVGGTVVGIVGDVKDEGLAEEHPPEIYVPYAQAPLQSMDVLLRTGVDPLSVRAAAERAVHELDPELAVSDVRTLDEIVARSISEPRFYMLLLTAFAATALLLAALGIFGVMSYAVLQRSREIGIRVALGADPKGVLAMVMGEAATLSALGVVLGLAGAVGLSRFLASQLFELQPTDPATFVAVAGLLAAVALLASYFPARRAARVDPLVALRAD